MRDTIGLRQYIVANIFGVIDFLAFPSDGVLHRHHVSLRSPFRFPYLYSTFLAAG